MKGLFITILLSTIGCIGFSQTICNKIKYSYTDQRGNQTYRQNISCKTDYEKLIESQDGMEIKLFPNPANQDFTLQWRSNSEIENSRVNIFSTAGVLVLSENVEDKNEIVIDSRNWAPGFYMVTVQGDFRTITSKISITH